MYPFHPRCGETVLVQRRFADRGVDLVVIPKPDGSVACIPAVMTHQRAGRFMLSAELQFSLENLRSLRAETDALLGFLQSDSRLERDGNGTPIRKPATESVQRGQASRCAVVRHRRSRWRRWCSCCCARSRRRLQTGRAAMSKITSEHFARSAIVYIRQSTADQLVHNQESQRRQYGLADRARQLGWVSVEVIDDDLGRSGSGVSRPGFERLLAAICEGRVGAVLAIEASRLARNGRDWHTLIEFCGLVGTGIVDEGGTYEPRHPNDRLLLGMKGTMSELELSLLRARSMEALKQKARRGELFFSVAIGYVKVGHDKIEIDPDLRAREAIGLVFTRFAEMQSIRQVFLSLRAERISLPYIDPKASGQHQLLWKPPVYATVSNLLTNPVYAGAYVFGRTGSRMTIENGRKRILRGYRKDRSDWAVLLGDHHEGYLSWADYERNQRLIADNANGKGMMVRGPVRKGEALLAGLLRCGHCGRRLLVSYNGTNGDVGRYSCDVTRSNPGAAACISFGALRVDEAVGAEIVRLLQPLGVEAAIQAITQCEHQSGEKQRQIELALEQARYEATRARRQYDTVDPDDRR